MKSKKQKEIYDKLVFDSGKVLSEIAYWFFDKKKATRIDESKINCPVLVIGASKDRTLPPSLTKKVSHKYNSVSTYKEFGNHAHWVLGEDGWDKITDYIQVWLRQTIER
jgi:pimeloyl-ACP methyl ester carboxylesterase